MHQNKIHKTAIVDVNVKMGKGNVIGPYCIIESGSTIGDYNFFYNQVNIGSKVNIENYNQFYPGVCIGLCGEMGAKGDRMKIGGQTKIGHYNSFRENVCMHAPVYNEQSLVGNHCYIMNNSYLAHDVHLANYVNLSAGVKLGGRVSIESYSNVGLNATVHQQCVIGEGAMIGMGAIITKAILPFMVAAGNPARLHKLNAIGLERRGFGEDEISVANKNLQDVFSDNNPSLNFITEKMIAFFKKYPDALVRFKRSD